MENTNGSMCGGCEASCPLCCQAASWNAAYGHSAHPYSSLADTRHVAGVAGVGSVADTFHPADYSRLSQYPPEGLYTHPPHGRTVSSQ